MSALARGIVIAGVTSVRGLSRAATALLGGRSPATRTAIVIAVIVVLGGGAGGLSAILGGLGVLALAAFGLWMIAAAPFQRQRRR